MRWLTGVFRSALECGGPPAWSRVPIATPRDQEAAGGIRERSEQQKRFFRRGKAAGWKDELSDDQVRRICEAHGEQMERFGYLSADGQPDTV